MPSKVKNTELKTQLVHSCILSQIDYCNALYYDLPAKDIKKLQRLMNASVRFIFNLKFQRVSITDYLKQAHLLPVNLRIKYKLCILVFKCINGSAPSYLSSLVSKKVSLPALRIASDLTLLRVHAPSQQNFKNRRFAIAAPPLRNSLLRNIRELTAKLKTYFYLKF